MLNRYPSHLAAVLQALFVTFLWSTSWVLIKFGLKDIPAVTFAGLRYGLAVLCLAPFALRATPRSSLRRLSVLQWAELAILGMVFIAATQGAQYVSLAYLPAVTVSLLLTSTVVIVAMLGILLLGERPAALQWVGIAIFLVGALIYFYPISAPVAGQVVGFVVAIAGVLANSLSAILGRHINRDGNLSPLIVTVVSMAVGAVALLAVGVLAQGLPRLSPANWAIIAWLAVVNTAFAFTLWNHTLRTLSATESSVINNTMLVQIAALAWLFLGERISGQEVKGMLMVVLGTLLVQFRPSTVPRSLLSADSAEEIPLQPEREP